MANEIPDNVDASLEALIDQTLGNLAGRMHREMTKESDRAYVRKWHAEYDYFERIIGMAHHQAWQYPTAPMTMEQVDKFLGWWYEDKLKSEAEIRAFEKEQGRPFPERPKK